MPESNETGLTEEEQVVMDSLVEAFRTYSLLPRSHKDEMGEFVLSIHRLQDLLAVRVARRLYPNGWYAGPKIQFSSMVKRD